MFPYPFSFLTTSETGLDQVANNYSMDFDGNPSHFESILDGNASPFLTGTNAALTVSFWFKNNTTPSLGTGLQSGIFRWGPTIGSYYAWIGFNFNKTSWTTNYFITTNGGGVTITSSNLLNPAEWNHLCMTRNATTNIWTLYINGSPDGTHDDSGSPAYQTNADNLYIGNTYPNYNYNGLIDEVAIWNITLDDAEVQSIYDATDTNLTADLSSMSTPPVAWYRMGD